MIYKIWPSAAYGCFRNLGTKTSREVSREIYARKKRGHGNEAQQGGQDEEKGSSSEFLPIPTMRGRSLKSNATTLLQKGMNNSSLVPTDE